MAKQKIPFVLVSSVHGTVILNRLDWRRLSDTHNEFGVGTDILTHGEFDLDLISMTGGLLQAARDRRGPGVMALDVGANIGIYTIEWARLMTDWGVVLSFEPQERIYYALAGNVAINNLFNAKVFNKAIGDRCKVIEIPAPDYQQPGQFGGLNLQGKTDIGQKIEGRAPIEMVSIDSIGLNRVDFIKIDVEGMEPEVIAGAFATLRRDRPYLLVEWHICGKEAIEKPLAALGYETVTIGMNLICAPKGDAVLPHIRRMFEPVA